MHIVDVHQFEASEVEGHGAEGVTIQWLIDESVGAPNFAMRRFVIAPGGHTPSHEHPWEHEAYIVRGHGEVILDDGPVAFGPDNAIFIPPDERHQFRNTGDEPLEMLCLVPNGPATEH